LRRWWKTGVQLNLGLLFDPTLLCFDFGWIFLIVMFFVIYFLTLTINFLNSIHGWVNWIKCLTKALNTHEMGLTRVYVYTLNQWFSKSIIDLILTLYQGVVKIKENPPRYQSEVSCIFKCWPGFSFLNFVDRWSCPERI
jgi:predicted membrane-bound spermidine synthase